MPRHYCVLKFVVYFSAFVSGLFNFIVPPINGCDSHTPQPRSDANFCFTRGDFSMLSE